MLTCSVMPPDDVSVTEHKAPRLPRRTLLLVSTGAMATLAACNASTATRPVGPEDPAAQWAAFRTTYIAPEGRVVDTGNGGISHSEGQGYAMLFAEAFDDRATFEQVYGWARRHLRRPDGLYSWRYKPTGRMPVEDPNNATDGDLYIAWALLRAADRWGEPEWRRDAQQIGQAILQKCVLEVAGRTVLLPGAQGFVHADRVVVNPSYYAFPALFALSRAVPDRTWQRLMGDGTTMLRQIRFGRWNLPADWVEMGRTPATASMLRPAQGWPARFSFDAVRIPLHLAWAGMSDEPSLRAAAVFWNDPSLPVRPAWTDLRSGQVAPYCAPAGIEAVAEVTTAAGWHRGLAKGLPSVMRSPDYYSAALSLASRLALQENPRNLVAVAAPAAVPARRSFVRVWMDRLTGAA